MSIMNKIRSAVSRTLEPLVRPGETVPITFAEANSTLYGTGDVRDLPVCRTVDGNVCSCWKIPLRKRLSVLCTGRVYLVVRGSTHPPLWIDTDAFVRPNTAVCGSRDASTQNGLVGGIMDDKQ